MTHRWRTPALNKLQIAFLEASTSPGSPGLSALPDLVPSEDRDGSGVVWEEQKPQNSPGSGHLLTWVLGSDHEQRTPVGTGAMVELRLDKAARERASGRTTKPWHRAQRENRSSPGSSQARPLVFRPTLWLPSHWSRSWPCLRAAGLPGCQAAEPPLFLAWTACFIYSCFWLLCRRPLKLCPARVRLLSTLSHDGDHMLQHIHVHAHSHANTHMCGYTHASDCTHMHTNQHGQIPSCLPLHHAPSFPRPCCPPPTLPFLT